MGAKVAAFEKELLSLGLLSGTEVAAVRAEAEGAIADAVRFATDAPAPSPADLTRDVYAAPIGG